MRSTNPMLIREELNRISQIANTCRTENTDQSISSMLRDLDSSIEGILGRVESDYYYLITLSQKVIVFLSQNEGEYYSPRQISENLFGQENLKAISNAVARILGELHKTGYVKKSRDHNIHHNAEFSIKTIKEKR